MKRCFAIKLRSISGIASISSRGGLFECFDHVAVVGSLGYFVLLGVSGGLSRRGTRCHRNKRSAAAISIAVAIATSETRQCQSDNDNPTTHIDKQNHSLSFMSHVVQKVKRRIPRLSKNWTADR